MTAVLSAVDALRKGSIMSLDDSHVNYSPTSSSTDWKSKYYEVADMLAETKNELDDFHQSSKELEEELERELQRTEKAQQDLKVKVERAEGEREGWKGKFMSLQTNHNTTTASLQRELDTLRQEHQKIKVQLRELEMGNDDLERNERAVSSSLADIESKYARALEEKILLEHELLDKAHLEEECQRCKDELRDANAEISILRDQLKIAHARASSLSSTSDSASPHAESSKGSTLYQSDEDLLHTKVPSDLQLADLSPEAEFTPTTETLPPSASSVDSDIGRTSTFEKPGISLPRHKFTSTQTPTSLARSTTLPKYSSPTTPSRIPPRTTVTRPTPRLTSTTSASNTASSTTPAPRNKGVQMVSEMRAKVRNLEQKIHTRVPRIRMGSTSRPNPAVISNAATTSSISRPSSLSSMTTPTHPPAPSRSSEDRQRPSMFNRHSSDQSAVKRTPGGDSTGWVLVMEDSPSPVKPKDKNARRLSSSGANAFRPFTSTAPSPPPLISPGLSRSTAMPTGLRRPQSRLSTSTEGRSSVSTTATVSTIPTPVSRPTTPTFLPLPTAGLYAHSSTTSTGNSKRSTGASAGGPYSMKRSSLGASMASPTEANYLSDSGFPHRDRPTSVPALSRIANKGTSSSPSSFKESPSHSGIPHSNVTLRTSKLPGSSLSQSRIGRPNFGVSGRRSAGGDPASDVERLTDGQPKTRPRSGSSYMRI
ncbi:hypothetical protein OF83DRAFT_1056787 [Amylostereum chailletii]|nr:hypothetical protein OF83DRAFT_1056787 [Amylostereum chailletii]